MSTQPDITFRSPTPSFGALNSFLYAQSKLGSNYLPVLQGEISNSVLFRIYNNFAMNSGIADAMNVAVTTYDGSSSASHTAYNLPVSQSWLHVLEHGFGENSTPTPDLYTRYDGVDTPVGGAANIYYAQKGSNGVYEDPRIRAGVSQMGVGYIEYNTYCSVPNPTVGSVYTFAVSVSYEWST